MHNILRGTGSKRKLVHPAQLTLLGFLIGIAAGTTLLALPISRTGPGGATLVEAFFTAVSAMCVTGHVIVDTSTYWTGFGQVVIMVLIQVGGFGVMTFASIIGIAVVRRLSLRSRITAAAETKNVGFGDVRSLVLGVLKISLVIEGVGALILFFWFLLRYGYSVGEAAWFALFHAVSSFNNAGFALFSDNMISFVDDPVVSLTLCAEIILGGLGFPVIVQLLRFGGNRLKWSMNTRIVLAATPLLLVAGAAYITLIEWNNPATLGPLDWPAKLLAGFFQSVQTRTAGFNSVDIGAMSEATQFGMTALMFIGGGPAGTAGGIKVTTFAVLFFILLAEVRGDGVVNVFGKRLSRAVHRQAIAVVLLSVGVVATSTVTIMLLSGLPLSPVLFETVSAFGTVGLSEGITPELPVAAQLILAVLMFVGRLGPIGFATALALRERAVLYELPKERPIIG
ncbi:TrkH family potassium uptake protein [Salinibacterium sp. UTAS2018]|uniref:TrkH family potassium uptake protein n=1 Tax=unclassified Salinibacterium TaxID=2632331 RepID=UPI00100958E3|nr:MULTISPECIES: potassium transporter TrkG [unclassified Salinibacterium]MBH0007775.1 TrkH family potassium uptake protein [Salinibacterium sp. SWN1162]QAV70879.1 TrkH family potassium uptake protein [Salinibacterium sp. UTAS2018]